MWWSEPKKITAAEYFAPLQITFVDMAAARPVLDGLYLEELAAMDREKLQLEVLGWRAIARKKW